MVSLFFFRMLERHSIPWQLSKNTTWITKENRKREEKRRRKKGKDEKNKVNIIKNKRREREYERVDRVRIKVERMGTRKKEARENEKKKG